MAYYEKTWLGENWLNLVCIVYLLGMMSFPVALLLDSIIDSIKLML